MNELVHSIGRWLPLLVLGTCITIACRTPPKLDYIRVAQDIDYILSEEPNIKDPWQVLEILPNLSADTFQFLYANKMFCDLKNRPSVCETAKKLKMHVGPNGVVLSSPQPLNLPSSRYQSNFDSSLVASYEALVKQNKVYYWELIDRRERIPHYCHQECLCTAQEMAKTLKGTNQNLTYIRLFPVGGMVKVASKTGYILQFPIHHTALLVKFADGGWGVVDQIAFGDTKVYSTQEWAKHILNFKSLSVSLEPVLN